MNLGLSKESTPAKDVGDLYGNDHPKKHAELWAFFMECVMFHLLAVFRHDAGKMQRFYISNGLKKPNRVSIRDFVQ
jgi:hypothetical protein